MVHPIDAYARAIVSGQLPAGKYHRLACVRHERDRTRIGTDPAFPYVLDLARIDRFVRFASRLKHYKGQQWAGHYIELQPYQVFRLGSIIGWVHRATGLRRFVHSYAEIPRKNGKSLEGAILALYLTFFDGEPGAEGYCAATKREQAKIVWGDAKRLVVSSALRSRLQALTSNIHQVSTVSKLEPLGADEDSLDGLNAHFINLDELHAMKTRGTIDVLETSTGSRSQPHVHKITTAGVDPISPCGTEHAYACQILEGTTEVDDRYFAFIAHADLDDDPWAESTWRKANPNFGISVNPEDLRAKATKARLMPEAGAAFKQKHLNLWNQALAPWLSIEGWRQGQHPDWSAEDLAHESCFVGIDLASKLDLTAMVFVFPPTEDRETWRLLRWVWTPAETLEDRAHRDRAPYPVWVEQGYLLTTPGTRVDHQAIRAVLVEARTLFDIQRIGFDPWHADQLIDQLVKEDGFAEEQVLEVRQTYAGMSSGCKMLEGAVLAGEVDAGGCPLMEWAFANAVVQRDGKDNIYPLKKRSRGRIDPLMATAIGFNLAIRSALLDYAAEDPDLVVA